MMAYPASIRALAAITMQADIGPNDELIELLIPRGAFDRIADFLGATRITSLSIEPGDAAKDDILRDLSACLSHAVNRDLVSDTRLVEDLTLTLLLHVAQQYGQMEPMGPGPSGGLSAWQWRLARRRLEELADGALSVEDVAAECGLSSSHFSRAFRYSTGLPPHRWLMRRRIEVAMDIMMRDDMPLSQVAHACGFSDQSHFTRSFSTSVGLPPARWRLEQHSRGEAHTS